MELLKGTVSSLVPWIANKVAEHVAYPFKVGSNIRALESSLRQLDAQKKDVVTTVMSAERQNGTPTEQLKLWLDEVEAIEQKAAEFSQKYQQLCRCICNVSPNLWSNYKISKRAAEQHAEVMKLCARETTIPVIGPTESPLAEEMPVSLSNPANLEFAIHHIMDDVHKIIGIWGMGGVGKTHLLKEIYNKIYKDSTFNVVLFVTCSRECSEEKVQNEIIDKLGLKMNSSENNSMEVRRSTIFRFLKQKSFVLLLDDLWSEINLEIVGIPSPYGIVDNCKRKVVLTTRSEEVCRLMEVDEKMRVNVLEWHEAWSLFKGKVSEHTIESNPVILKYAVDVVKELGGLPLALITVGRAMHDRTDPGDWKHAVDLLTRARLHDVEPSGRVEPVFKVLKFSYDKLRNDNLRECFLHCSLWPEDHTIDKNELVELWMGLGLIDENDIHMAYNNGYKYISMLQSVCLLESSDNDSQVKLHDVIRDMSLWIISSEGVERNKWIVRSRASNQPRVVINNKTEKISLRHHHADGVSFPSFEDSRLSTFLFTWSSLSSMPDLQRKPFLNLTVLNLKQNKIKDFPRETCNLGNLQFVDLSDNEIGFLPSEIAVLINLKYLFLKGNPLCEIKSGAIDNLESLKVLDLSPPSHHIIKEKRHKLVSTEYLLRTLSRLPEFGALGIEICNMMQMDMLSSLDIPVRWLTISMWDDKCRRIFRRLQDPDSSLSINLFSLSIANTREDWGDSLSTFDIESSCELEGLEHLDFYGVGMREIWRGELHAPMNVFPFLKCITISRCDRLENISWVVHLPCLQELAVSVCKNIIHLIYIYVMPVPGPTFPSLKLLVLEGLPELKTICDPEIVFPALETLKIFGCDELRKFPFRADNIPPKLNHIWVEEKWWDVYVHRSQEAKDSESSLIEYVRFLY